jgi:hypothetical protein
MLEWSRALIKRIEEDCGAIDPLKDLFSEGKGMAGSRRRTHHAPRGTTPCHTLPLSCRRCVAYEGPWNREAASVGKGWQAP